MSVYPPSVCMPVCLSVFPSVLSFRRCCLSVRPPVRLPVCASCHQCVRELYIIDFDQPSVYRTRGDNRALSGACFIASRLELAAMAVS